MFNLKNKTMNVLHYAAIMQNQWENEYRSYGKEPISTFYQDLTIGEFFDGGLQDTFDRIKKSWIDDYKMFTEFIVCLNHKIWEHYDKGNERLARFYDTLWRDADYYFLTKYEDNDEVMLYYCMIVN